MAAADGRAESPAQAVRDARVVITMLPAADIVNSVIFGDGVAEAFAEGAVWAQMGTIGVPATAEAGQLLILASGPRAAEAVAQPAAPPCRC